MYTKKFILKVMEKTQKDYCSTCIEQIPAKHYLAIETMLSFESGIIGFPLRLLAREVYDKVIKKS